MYFFSELLCGCTECITFSSSLFHHFFRKQIHSSIRNTFCCNGMQIYVIQWSIYVIIANEKTYYPFSALYPSNILVFPENFHITSSKCFYHPLLLAAFSPSLFRFDVQKIAIILPLSPFCTRQARRHLHYFIQLFGKTSPPLKVVRSFLKKKINSLHVFLNHR